MQKIYGLLIDTVSIQSYIFSSNKLKENIGASYIVENIFGDFMKKCLEDVFDKSFNLDSWQENKYMFMMKSDKNLDFEVGYIGGGKALLFFNRKEKMSEFTKHWSKKLLLEYPGINTAVAIDEYDPDEAFKIWFDRMNKQLRKNKNENLLNTTVRKMNISEDCKLSDFAAECTYHDADGESRISKSSKVKLQNTEKSNIGVKKLCLDDNDKWEFTDQVDKLWQKEGDNYIALVHIDGNNMGVMFQGCSTLEEIRELSHTIYEITRESYKELINYIIKNEEILKNEKYFDKKKFEKNILPIRSIVIGGDDVTFVCNAKLGIHIAEKFIEIWTKQSCGDKKLSACAGIAIVKSKYPFYRAYTLCEHLCSGAKKLARENIKTIPNSNWINFYIYQDATSKDIEEINSSGFGPYILFKQENKKSIDKLINGIKTFDKKWPKSKQMLLRSLLQEGNDIESKIDEFKIRDLHLPENGYNEEYTKKGSFKGKSPYLDMIEVADYYPVDMIDKIKGDDN